MAVGVVRVWLSHARDEWVGWDQLVQVQVQMQIRMLNDDSDALLPVCLPETQSLSPDEVLDFRGWFECKEDGE